MTLKLIPVALILGASAGKVLPNGFSLPDQDAFATARGEAFAATADNPSAIYYNPAGITQLAGCQIRGGVNALDYDPSFNPPGTAPNAGETYHDDDHLAAVPHFFFTCTPSNGPVSYGLGVYAPFGGKIGWPQDTGFRAVAISGSLQYVTLNPVVALKVSPAFSLAAGAMVNYGKLKMSQGLKDSYSARAINYFNFDGDGWSAGYNLGALWQPDEKISFGATFRSAARLDFQGDTRFQLYPGSYNSPAQRAADAEFTFPLTAVMGVSWRPTPKWNLEFDANCTDWSSFDTVTIRQSPPAVSNPLVQNIPVNLGWRTSWMYEFGVTRYFAGGWHASVGYAFNEGSVPDTYYTPLAADLDRHFFSAGFGFEGRRFDFDLAYQFGYGPARTVSGSTSSTAAITASSGETADGAYHFISHAVSVSAGVRF